MRKMIVKIVTHLRRLIGVTNIRKDIERLNRQITYENNVRKDEINLLRRELKYHNHQFDKIISYMAYSNLEENKIKESKKFEVFQKFRSLLSPMDVIDSNYRRVGKDFDGGYVMLDDFSGDNITAAYSFGISNDVSWDEEMAKAGIDVYMYDHTIEKLPKENKRFFFFKQGVTGKPEEGLETLSTLMARNGHQESNKLILKMDIEGYEWGVFEETSIHVIEQFVQIVIEFHGLSPKRSKEELSLVFKVLEKINKTHQSIHVHANGHTPVSWLGEWALPELLEVTYVRRKDYAKRLIQNTRTFPTSIDQPTSPWLPDVSLGKFSVQDKSFGYTPLGH